MISSTANPRVVRVRRLRKRRERERRGVILVEGRRAVRAALEAGKLEELYATPAAARRDPELIAAAKRSGADRADVTAEVMAHLTTGTSAPGVMGVAHYPDQIRPEGGPALVLLSVRDPASAGSMLATLDAIGSGGAIIAPGCTDIYAPRVVRAAGGAHYRCRHVVQQGSATDAFDGERARGATLVALREIGPAPWECDLRGNVSFLIGSEQDDAEILEKADLQVAVPSDSGGPGLALRTAVVLYEWVRQRGKDA